MSSPDMKALLEAASLDLLEPDDQLALTDHVSACTPCGDELAALADALGGWTAAVDAAEAEAPLEAAVKQRLLARLDGATAGDAVGEPVQQARGADGAKPKGTPLPAPTADAEALGIKVKLTCCFCHAPTRRHEVTFCATCLAPHHRDCFREYGRCSTPGCEETRTVRPAEPDLGQAPERRRPRRAIVLGALFSAGLVGGGLAALGPRSASPAEIARLRSDVSRHDEALDAALLARDEARVNEAWRSWRTLSSRTLELPGYERNVASAAATAERRAKAFLEEPRATVVKVNAYLRDVCAELSVVAGHNILVDPNVEEVITVSLSNLRWRDALDVVARMTRCTIEERPGGVIMLTQPPKVTIQFTDANVRTVMQLLAAYSGKNIVVSPNVAGNVTVDFKEVHWLEALLSLADVLDFRVWEIGQIVMVTTRDEHHPRNALPLRLAPTAKERKHRAGGPQVTLGDREGTLLELADAIAQQAKVDIRIDGDAPEGSLRLDLTDVPWQGAVEALAEVAGCRVLFLDAGARATLIPLPDNVLVARGCNVRTWIQLLAANAATNVVIAPGVSGRVSLDLKRVDYLGALESTATALGFVLEQGEGVLRVRSSDFAEPESVPENEPTQVELPGGVTHDVPPLHALLLDGERSFAVLGDFIYKVGDRLIDPDTEEELEAWVVGAITPRGVVLSYREVEAQVHLSPAERSTRVKVVDWLRPLERIVVEGDAARYAEVDRALQDVPTVFAFDPRTRSLIGNLKVRRAEESALAAYRAGGVARAIELLDGALGEADVRLSLAIKARREWVAQAARLFAQAERLAADEADPVKQIEAYERFLEVDPGPEGVFFELTRTRLRGLDAWDAPDEAAPR